MTAFPPTVQAQPSPSSPNPPTPPHDLQSDFTHSVHGYGPPYRPTSNMNGSRLLQRHSTDFRPYGSNGAMAGANGNGPLPVPSGNTRGAAGFDGPRSPPSNKNTSHVPCKFFRQGACQAGKACPFSHSLEPVVDTPCKYFQKGNCKFGYKCALAHILPDGRRANRPNFGMGGGPLNLGGRVNLHPQTEPSASSSLLTMQQAHLAQPQPPAYQMSAEEYLYGPQQPKSPYDVIPTIDTTFLSHPGSTYGSPPNDGRLPISPVQKGLSVMDAPLPASFDSQGISHMARYGPIAASVPSRFGFETSPPSSLPNKTTIDSSALRNLHNSAFGDDSRNGRSNLASSPPTASEEPMGRRIMHSERFARPKMMSASLGARPPISAADDWDENFAFEEDLVPTSLHELLTPQEKMRRFSRTGEDDHILSHRHSLSGLGTPADSTSKVGSPSTASPSRFSALFSRTHKPEPTTDPSPLNGSFSAFGHVGSPLRNSSLHPNASPSLRAVSSSSRPTSGDVSPFVSSPPRQSSMSMISQQLQRTRLSNLAGASDSPDSAAPSSSLSLHPGMVRIASGSSVGSSVSGAGGRLDRAVSSNSVGRGRIVEEDLEQELFSMDDEVGEEKERERERKKENVPPNGKRYSGGWTFGVGGKGSPSLGPIGGQRMNSGGSGGAAEKGRVWNGVV